MAEGGGHVMQKHLARLLLCLALLASIAGSAEAAPAGPTATVQEYLAALVTAKSPSALEKYRTQRAQAEESSMTKALPPARQAKYLSYLKLGLPARNKAVSEQITGDSALVVIEKVGEAPMEKYASSDPSVTMVLEKYGSYFLKRENGTWKIDTSSWNADLARSPKKNPIEYAAWAQEASKAEFSQGSVQGKFLGIDFTPDTVTIGKDPSFGGCWLTFSQKSAHGKDADAISLGLLDDGCDVEGRTFQIANQALSWKKKSMFNIRLQSNKLPNYSVTYAGVAVCGMKLVFDKKTKDGIPGKIVLRLSSQPETSLSGSFVAR